MIPTMVDLTEQTGSQLVCCGQVFMILAFEVSPWGTLGIRCLLKDGKTCGYDLAYLDQILRETPVEQRSGREYRDIHRLWSSAYNLASFHNTRAGAGMFAVGYIRSLN